ncbi:hypothetical protein BST11_26420 [Mycobacterium alsense]|uniref:Uncharacterized protein n=1 Tax=Mycobacterium alsense TaxID=324058 RepID=A0AA42BXS3_9MYCO|nr:hypothetical protein [Mycobacterium alsense]MCV7377888.1 hypothetical protein [Mycobacterium alsense]OQZ87750.1 hypothetical protein BST11_26420 [Mycobacterium alsense]
MNPNKNVTVGSGAHGVAGSSRANGDRGRNVWPWVNWGLALATVPAAAIVMLFALGAVMSTDGCSGGGCPDLGRGGIDFGVAFYGAPAVAFAVIVISFFTARRRGGIVVPVAGWALLVADVVLMAAAVS